MLYIHLNGLKLKFVFTTYRVEKMVEIAIQFFLLEQTETFRVNLNPHILIILQNCVPKSIRYRILYIMKKLNLAVLTILTQPGYISMTISHYSVKITNSTGKRKCRKI